MLYSSMGVATAQTVIESDSIGHQKKEMISKALQSLIQIYESKNEYTVSQKFKTLDSSTS